MKFVVPPGANCPNIPAEHTCHARNMCRRSRRADNRVWDNHVRNATTTDFPNKIPGSIIGFLLLFNFTLNQYRREFAPELCANKTAVGKY